MSMLREFTYAKQGSEVKEYKVLTLNNADTYLEGLSIADLPKDDQDKLVAIFEKFRADIDPYFKKNYRKFNKASIIKEKQQ